jgi:nitrite reductase (NO-forming)
MTNTLSIIVISAILLSGLVYLPGIKMSAYAQEEEVDVEDVATGNVVNIQYIGVEKNLTLPTGDVVKAYTWNGTVPGPTFRVTQGDTVNITVTNAMNNTQIHSLDTHASTVSAVPNYGPLNPGQSLNYSFVASQPGYFKVHCEGNGVLTMDEHVFQGMVSTMLVDPANGYSGYTTISGENGTAVEVSPDAKEVELQFSEYYLNADGSYNSKDMFNHNATSAWINGIPFGYDPIVTKTQNATPLFFNQGDHVRFFLMNHGDWPVNFHIVGEILDRVTDGSLVNGIGKQTYTVGGSNDAIVDVVFDKPGVYAFVNHDYAQLFKGQVGLVVVDAGENSTSASLNLTDTRNPSNAIAPQTGPNTIQVETKPYGLGVQ